VPEQPSLEFEAQGDGGMSEQNAVVAVYETHAGAEEAIKELQG
jgi:hypothetical protein